MRHVSSEALPTGFEVSTNTRLGKIGRGLHPSPLSRTIIEIEKVRIEYCAGWLGLGLGLGLGQNFGWGWGWLGCSSFFFLA
jgi:hypothetical protein